MIRLPDIELESTIGPSAPLSDHYAKGMLVIVFVPDLKSSTYALTPFARRRADFDRLGCCVLGLASEPIDVIREFADEQEVHVPILADQAGVAVREMNLHIACRPVVLIVDRDGLVRESITFPGAHIDGILDRLSRMGES